ncbi:sulfatase-like hydrolase/transferase [Phenylobacterium sp.]|uniref:sulfatase-like hydrolase/transferase n=1 Tax=Phenylobacterium sp. TaxID=1871053 RepID=UPI0035B1B9E0
MSLIRRTLGLPLAFAALASLLISSCTVPPQDRLASRPASPKRPNVIVILADDLGYADVSAYGVKRIHTPHIDAIGDQGVKFTDAYAAAPVCSPSRAGLQTGRNPDRYGFEYNNGPPERDARLNLGLDIGEITIAQALKDQGYHTALIGKWHLGANPDFYPTNRGYDDFVGLLAGATSYIDPSVPGVHVADPPNSSYPSKAARSQHTAIYEGAERKLVHNETEYLTDYFARRAVDYVSARAKSDQPYFLYLAFNAPHDPLMVTQKYYDRFPHIASEQNRIYAGMISALDDAVGQVMAAVKASGEDRDTLVYFMSDNGCAAYIGGLCACEPLRGGKLSHYEGGVRVPFMVRWPAAIKPGQVNRKMVSNMDIFPTSLIAAGGALPKDRIYDGVDLMPFLSGRNTGSPHEALMWRRTPHASIRKGDWKMWKSTDGKFTLLFNLKADPNETTNLATREPAKLKELNDAYEQWAKDLQDPKWPSRPAIQYNVCGTPFELPI